MILRAALALLALTPLVLGGQIPVVEGVLGGVPSRVQSGAQLDAVRAQTKEKLSTEANTPGKLRLVENSGVCGMFLPTVSTP
jgi:hypothetical protein